MDPRGMNAGEKSGRSQNFIVCSAHMYAVFPPWPRVQPSVVRALRAAAGLCVSGARRPRAGRYCSPGRG